MRNVLLVENPTYLERALEDVLTLFRFPWKQFETEEISDLLAVIVMSSEASNCLTWSLHTCDVASASLANPLFTGESFSVNGIWILLTLNRVDLLAPTPRHHSLEQILTILGEEPQVKNKARVYPVFPDHGPLDSVAEQLDHLTRTHHDVLATHLVLLPQKQVEGSFRCVQLARTNTYLYPKSTACNNRSRNALHTNS